MPVDGERTIAYFSMEIGLEEGVPTYSGGLGILAGDTIRSAADLHVPMVAVSLLHRKGYFYQRLDARGVQYEDPVEWAVDDFVKPLPARVQITLQGRQVHIAVWQYDVAGYGGGSVPVYLLDTDLAENSEADRAITHYLYGGDHAYRLCQEAVLGIGGVRALRALGHTDIQRFHMNEGHASLLTLELLDEQLRTNGGSITPEAIDAVRRKCIFTTHTPVPAGHDKFPLDTVRSILGDHPAFRHPGVFCCDDTLNMTYLALNLSHYVNGVAKKHGEVSQHMFAQYQIDSITNGVHAATWVSQPFAELFDRYVQGWREDNFSLRYALNIPHQEIWNAHQHAKRALFECVNRESNAGMDADMFTLGFARRAATYKRADLIFSDLERLRSLVSKDRPLQIIFAGKAHPRDQQGKDVIQRIFTAAQKLKGRVKVIYLPNYDITLARMLTSGVDVWLNTPQRPMEASGTSGMKAALNGVPSLSVLDGWWIEGCIEEVTGWAIGSAPVAAEQPTDSAADAASLYDKLEKAVIPAFYLARRGFIDVMRHAIALNGSFFNTQRMVQQYVLKGYFH